MLLSGEVQKGLANRLVCGNPAGRNQRAWNTESLAEDPQAVAQPVDHHLDHRKLERRAQIGHVLVRQGRDLFGFEAQRSLETG